MRPIQVLIHFVARDDDDRPGRRGLSAGFLQQFDGSHYVRRVRRHRVHIGAADQRPSGEVQNHLRFRLHERYGRRAGIANIPEDR
jgi:hypothetical protein